VKKFQQLDFQQRWLAALLPALLAMSLGPVASETSARTSGPARRACKAPRLTRLTLDAARRQAAHAGCTLRVKGARLQDGSVQTIEWQAPPPNHRSSLVRVGLNPLCHGSAAQPPAIKEPQVTAGPTALIGGFYYDGGPSITFSRPKCRRPEPKPSAGSVEVLDSSGTVVAASTVVDGELADIPLTPGTYTLRGTFLDTLENGAHPVQTELVVIEAGHRVRQDFVWNGP
jgi:hypothetical protein